VSVLSARPFVGLCQISTIPTYATLPCGRIEMLRTLTTKLVIQSCQSTSADPELTCCNQMHIAYMCSISRGEDTSKSQFEVPQGLSYLLTGTFLAVFDIQLPITYCRTHMYMDGLYGRGIFQSLLTNPSVVLLPILQTRCQDEDFLF
jgi:hypothetical protein